MDSSSIRNTKQRQVILDALMSVRSHPTASELYEMVKEKLPKISLGTVYRNLEKMAKAGEIRKLDKGQEARFDADLEQHYHIRCSHCGKVDDVHEVAVKILGDNLDLIKGYDITGHYLEFSGVCPACKGNMNSH